MASIKDFNHVDLLFPGKYLKAADLRGRDVTVTIERIDPREELQMRGGKVEQKPVIYIKGAQKAWVLNKTNALSIAKVYGNEVTGWIGKAVTLYPARVQCGGKEVDAIRVRETAPKSKAKASAPEREPAHDPATGEVTGTESADYNYGPPAWDEKQPGSEG